MLTSGLKLLGRVLGKVSFKSRAESCYRKWTRTACGECQHINLWKPRYTTLAKQVNDSRVNIIVQSLLEMQEDTLRLFCDSCTFFEIEQIEDGTWLDGVTCECLCRIGRMMGFDCVQCWTVPGFTFCGAETVNYSACDNITTPYIYQSEEGSLCAPMCAPRIGVYEFDVCNEPEEYRRFLEAFLLAKVSDGLPSTLLLIMGVLFPNDTVSIIDASYGKAWFTLDRPLTQHERSLRPLYERIMGLPVGVSFRIVEPI